MALNCPRVQALLAPQHTKGALLSCDRASQKQCCSLREVVLLALRQHILCSSHRTVHGRARVLLEKQ